MLGESSLLLNYRIVFFRCATLLFYPMSMQLCLQHSFPSALVNSLRESVSPIIPHTEQWAQQKQSLEDWLWLIWRASGSSNLQGSFRRCCSNEGRKTNRITLNTYEMTLCSWVKHEKVHRTTFENNQRNFCRTIESPQCFSSSMCFVKNSHLFVMFDTNETIEMLIYPLNDACQVRSISFKKRKYVFHISLTLAHPNSRSSCLSIRTKSFPTWW